MGGCQNYAPFLGTLNIRCRIITGIQRGTIILTATHIRIIIGKENGNYRDCRDYIGLVNRDYGGYTGVI